MQHTTIDHAISLICLVSQGAWLSKADITSAFKVLPIHPDFWGLFGVLWKKVYGLNTLTSTFHKLRVPLA